MANNDVTQMVKHLDELAAAPPNDARERARLYDAATRLATALESPHDTVYRIIYSPVLLTIAEVASNMQIFQTLAANEGHPSTAAQLAAVTGADVTLTGRIARNLASHGLIAEAGEDQFKANQQTKALDREGLRAGVRFYFHGTMPCLQALPQFLQETGYANPADSDNTPFSKAFNTKLRRFPWMEQHPEHPANAPTFGLWMTAQHDRSLTWLNVLDFGELTRGADANTPVFVDIAGGIGGQCAVLKGRFPDLVGRVVLEDTAAVLEHALPTPGVEKIVFDFWTEQVVKGAKVYYFRYIMHDYSDVYCRTILKNTMAAMGRDSVILIDDVIIPNTGAHSHSTDKDIAMMINLAAMERTESQWQELFRSVGLRRVKAAVYNELSGESIQVLEKIEQA